MIDNPDGYVPFSKDALWNHYEKVGSGREKSYKVEKQPQFSEDPRRQAIFCRWKSTKEVVDLVKNSGENYDFILHRHFTKCYHGI